MIDAMFLNRILRSPAEVAEQCRSDRDVASIAGRALRGVPRDLEAVFLNNADLARVGEDRVVGLACTVWSVHARNGDGTVCITGDGVPLRLDGTVDGRKGTLTATAIDFSPQPPSLFQVPTGFMSFSLPKFK